VGDSEGAASEKGSVSRAAGVVGFYTLLSRILGLVRDMVVARYFGSGMAADAFFVAFRIPNLLRRLFAEGSLTIAFIPSSRVPQPEETGGRLSACEGGADPSFPGAGCGDRAGHPAFPVDCEDPGLRIRRFRVKYDLTVLLTRITFPYILLVSLVAFSAAS